jgi:hypothetical protein
MHRVHGAYVGVRFVCSVYRVRRAYLGSTVRLSNVLERCNSVGSSRTCVLFIGCMVPKCGVAVRLS